MQQSGTPFNDCMKFLCILSYGGRKGNMRMQGSCSVVELLLTNMPEAQGLESEPCLHTGKLRSGPSPSLLLP